MRELFGYFCPVCGAVEISATRRVNPYHRAPGLFGFKSHAMTPAGTYPDTMRVDEIKAAILARDWNSGVREIESVSTEIVGVKYEPAKQPRWRRQKVK